MPTELHNLCGCCGTITPDSEWSAWVRDDETDELVPAGGQTDPILRCPICKHDFTDDDAGPLLWRGTRREMVNERASYVDSGALNAVDNWVEKLEEIVRAERVGPQVFVVTYEQGAGAKWSVDGAHSLDSDLTETYRILNALGKQPIVLKLTIDERRWPTVENVTAEALGVGQAPPLPFMEARDAG